ncbi:hypothetical protein BC829DRAFT_392137 [Chytridium lagenaria]|nr:hypothetical protein BC829DRAFT_392137 [Chytridium lagenaria]
MHFMMHYSISIHPIHSFINTFIHSYIPFIHSSTYVYVYTVYTLYLPSLLSHILFYSILLLSHHIQIHHTYPIHTPYIPSIHPFIPSFHHPYIHPSIHPSSYFHIIKL